MSYGEEVNNSTFNTQHSTLIGVEPPLRYYLGRSTIGTPSLRLYGRTLVGVGIWLGAPPLLAGLLGRLGARGAMHAIERWWARRMVSHLRIRLDLSGLEQIDRRERYVVTPLHEGFADALALFHLPLDLRFVARDELFTWRFLGRYLRTTRQIEITPEQGARGYRQLLRGAREAYAAGESVVVFPQGTILGIESEFMAGAFALARTLERPILPVALTGSHRIWEHPYTPRLRYGQRMSLRVLPPIAVKRNH